MDSLEVVNVLSRWVHIGTAIVVLGGTVFLRYVLAPAAEALPESEHNALRERVMKRWRIIVHAGVVLFLLSGFYNYLVVAVPNHHGDGLYHALMGCKIILAFVVFFLAEALVGRAARFEGLRRERKRWLQLLIILAFIVVFIAGYLKVRQGKVGPANPNKNGISTSISEINSEQFSVL